ncbi:hypothetical protein EW146_g1476 [Bondarzewia mesenterica]|uniref:Uncharacterized protein n=1 Tax=Bondarzewia mesenterica TaxID=1095465 RepID=A0A4S4M3H9_9AGAM|nr:hypothetical protein EW146_g1476 [Bondarzewia mesenterica]
MSERTYEIVPGFFIQDDPKLGVDPESIGPTPPSFGLLSGSWPDFVSNIKELNSAAAGAPIRTSYKVLFLGRHGQGYHNLAINATIIQAWDDHWSLIEGDDEITWGPDPHLTPLGEEQARNANAAWKAELAAGMPFPQKHYSSPHRRAMHTLSLTFDEILQDSHLKPVVVENWREESGEHTCDKRRTRSEIEAEFPGFLFEEGFSEEDLLWTDERESKAQTEVRAKRALDGIFRQDEEHTYISVTAHGGIIDSVLRVIGRGDYKLLTGGIIVVVVKGTMHRPRARISKSFESHPHGTLAITGGALNALGDAVAQLSQQFLASRSEYEDRLPYDLTRTLRFFCFGAGMSPLIGRWNHVLEKWFPLRRIGGSGRVSFGALSKRVAVDQVVMCVFHIFAMLVHLQSLMLNVVPRIAPHRAPIGLAIFLGSMGVMEGRDTEHIRGKYRDLFHPVLLANWKVWPAAQVGVVTTFSRTRRALTNDAAHKLPLHASGIPCALPANSRSVLDALPVYAQLYVRFLPDSTSPHISCPPNPIARIRNKTWKIILDIN